MKHELTSLDLFYMVKELKSIEGAKVDKIYEQDSSDPENKTSKNISEERKDFLFVVRRVGEEKKFLRIKLPKLAYLTQTKPEFPDSPPGFCMFLRKYLTNARIKEIRQRGFERILEIVFDTKEGDKTLICEMFSKGNMILVDAELKIKGLLESQNWESRIIRGGTKYTYPPVQIDTSHLTMLEFEKIVTSSTFDQIVKCFAIELSLGGFYAEELCLNSGIAKDKKRLNPDEINRSYIELSKLFRMTPYANSHGDEILPFKTSLAHDKEYASFSDAIDDLLTEKIENSKSNKENKVKETKQKKIMLVIEKQEERLNELEKTAIESQRKGELIYENYTDVKELLDKINSDRKKLSWEEIKKKYKDVQIDEKKGTITIDL